MSTDHSVHGSVPWFVQALSQSLDSPAGHVQFFTRYAALRALLGTGAWTLAGRVGRSQGVFFDPHEPLAALSGKGLQVAEAIVSAGRALVNHARHAQQVAQRVIEIEQAREPAMDDLFVNTLFVYPSFLLHLDATLDLRFGGAGEGASALFRGLGYLMGVEVLDRQVWQACQQLLPDTAPYLLPALQGSDETGKQDGAWEASDVIELAVGLAPRENHEEVAAWIQEGLSTAWEDHAGFFNQVDLPPPAG